MAGLPFLNVTGVGLLISRFVRHLTQNASIIPTWALFEPILGQPPRVLQWPVGHSPVDLPSPRLDVKLAECQTSISESPILSELGQGETNKSLLSNRAQWEI